LHADDYVERGVPFILIKNIRDGRIDPAGMPSISEEDAGRLRAYSLRRGDVVFSRVGRVGSCFLAGQEHEGWIISGQLLRLRLAASHVESGFLVHWLNSELIQSTVAGAAVGTTRQSINTDILGSLPIPCIPVREQRRIAEILDTLDEAIRKTEELITKVKQVKQGLLHDLLTRGIDDNGELRDPARQPNQFRDSPFGRTPQAWEICTLESLCRSAITYGIVQPGPHIADGVPFVQTKDLRWGLLDSALLDRTSQRIADEYHRSRVAPEDVLCGIRASVGDVVQVPPSLDNANISRGVARISPKSEVVARYLFWAMQSPPVRRQLARETKGTTYAEITLPALRGVRVPCPRRHEQEKIAEVLDAHTESESVAAREVDKLRDLKRGLMVDLLAGRVRVTNLVNEKAA
jgi:type I restriction enzyme S subunit